MSYRMGVLGYASSHFARSHGKHLKSAGHVVAAVYDPARDKMLRAMREHGDEAAVICGSAEELVRHPGVDAVMITSVDAAHAEQLELAIAAGKPVFCDKPLALNRKDLARVERAIRTAQSRKIPVMSCYPREDSHNPNLPYSWTTAQLPSLIRKYGDLCHIALDFSYPAPDTSWKIARSLLADHATHELGLIRHWQPSGKLQAWRVADGPDYYNVVGSVEETSFSFVGTRRLAPNHKGYPEEIRLRFWRATCVVRVQMGEVLITEHESQQVHRQSISKMDKSGYDRVFEGVTRSFLDTLAKPSLSRYDHLIEVNSLMIDLLERGSCG
ncbi:MAG TPA: Gfo/Idh/MocA family oxidoreductase [Verrucomicrobiae bacterium]|nr:Gfo/Idh/MocA family oxidoreductase [Verrucomicrobiae bacterium]